jgi:solute carrier family 34 (sodium-dependent phosphate cotransporter)
MRVLPGWASKLLWAALGLIAFILALELLKDGARGYGRTVITLLEISGPLNALGFGWLLAYLFLSGSPVAAIAVTFFSSGTITALEAFTMITGSRLGASFIVLFVGFIYYVRGHQRSASIAIGVLALLTTAAIYLPAMLLGWAVLVSGWLPTPALSAESPLSGVLDLLVDPVMNQVRALQMPGWAHLLLGVGALLGAFQLLDRALPEISAERSSFQRIGVLVYRPMAMFLLGCAVTSVTMSVSVSLGILVPLSAKGMVRRENTLPYIMGANITTFIDTLVAALVTGGPAAFTIVLVEMLSVAFFSILVLSLCYRQFASGILRLQEGVIETNARLGLFLGVMLVVPALLLLLQ